GGDDTEEGDDEAEGGDDTEEGDDEAEGGDDTEEGDDEAEGGDDTEDGDDEAEDGDDTEDGDDEAGVDIGDVFAVTGRLVGTPESEKLQGYESDDRITGGSGPDLFPLTAGNDVVTDFQPTEDVIDVGDFARASDEFGVLTSLDAIAANSTQATIGEQTALVIDVDGESGSSSTALLGVTINDLNSDNVFFGLGDTSIPPLDFTHLPEATVTLNDGTVARIPGHDLSVHPLPFELVSGSQSSVDALNGVDSSGDQEKGDTEALRDARKSEDPGQNVGGTFSGATAAQIDAQLGLNVTGNFFDNWMGKGERWIWGTSGWHFITPVGALYEWGGGTSDDVLIARLDPSIHADPTLLTTASEQQPEPAPTNSNVAAEAIRLDTELGLRSTSNNFENWIGRQERWLWGAAGWYYLLPDGALFQWTTGSMDGTQIGQLDSRSYDDLEVLTSASQATSIDEVFARIATGTTVV
ncbi:MAG: hypothetical protein GY903_09530, partial [Fuerstiella sp.]|nr:hypothetical protein [Fuerstiella sp.]